MHHVAARRGRGLARAGFSLLEVLCAVAVLSLAALGLSRTMIASSQLADTTRQRAIATEAARLTLEELQDADFATVFKRYDASTANNPAPPVTSPGAGFAVAGLEPIPGDPDGLPGEIVFPVVGTQLRENMSMRELGMPHDLNGDGIVDATDHASNYQLLPVLVRVVWRGDTAPMKVELRTILAQR